MKNTKTFVVLIVMAIIAIGAYGLLKESPKQVSVDEVVKQVKAELGSVSGPDIQSSYLSVNGVTRHFNSVQLTQGSTTLCAIKSPNATSTLVSGAINFSRGTTTASIVEMAKSTTFATTTLLIGTYPIPANQLATIVASTTPLTQGTYVFGPNQYFVVKWAVDNGGYGAGTVPTGLCQATFESF